MHCWRYILAVVALILVAQTTANCRKRRQVLQGGDLRTLLGSKITHTQVVRRPLGSGSIMVGPLSHSGMIVETSRPVAGTNRWLVHKGPGFGRNSQTVVTRADDMSSRWITRGSRRPGDGSTVSDFVRRGGRNYNVFTNNCHHAVTNMRTRPRSNSGGFWSGVRRRWRSIFN